MQKKLIALAVAGLASTGVFAADNVTMYGVIDAAMVNVNGTGLKGGYSFAAGGLAASRIGVKGEEDLGGGTKVLAVLEYQLDTMNNTGMGSTNGMINSSTLARQQMLGLTGNFGTFATGRLQTAGYDFTVKYDALGGSTLSPVQNLTVGKFLIGGIAGLARANTAVAYISPDMGGVKLAANYALVNQPYVVNNSATGIDRQAAWLLAADYNNGPFGVGLVWAKLDTANGFNNATPGVAATAFVAANGSVTKEWALGASYNFGVATVKASYQAGSKDCTATTVCGNTNKAYGLSAAIPAGPGVLALGWGKTSISTADQANSSGYTVAWLQPISKRTTAYFGYNRMTNDANATTTVDNNVGAPVYDTKGVQTSGLTAGGSSNMLAVGLNHKF